MVETRSITVAGHCLGVVAGNEQGAGTPVVFLPGILGSAGFWPPLLPDALCRNRRLVFGKPAGPLSWRFPGRLRAEDVTPARLADLLGETILRLVGVQAVGLVGWSTGACLALQLAAQRPWQVKSVLSVAGFAKGRWHGILGLMQKLARWNAVSRFAFRGALRTMAANNTFFRWSYSLAAADAHSLLSSKVARRVLGNIRPTAARSDLKDIRLLFASIHDWDVTDCLRTIRVPVTIAAGDRDPIIRYKDSCALADAIPAAACDVHRRRPHVFRGIPGIVSCLFAYLAELFHHRS